MWRGSFSLNIIVIEIIIKTSNFIKKNLYNLKRQPHKHLHHMIQEEAQLRKATSS